MTKKVWTVPPGWDAALYKQDADGYQGISLTVAGAAPLGALITCAMSTGCQYSLIFPADLLDRVDRVGPYQIHSYGVRTVDQVGLFTVTGLLTQLREFATRVNEITT